MELRAFIWRACSPTTAVRRGGSRASEIELQGNPAVACTALGPFGQKTLWNSERLSPNHPRLMNRALARVSLNVLS